MYSYNSAYSNMLHHSFVSFLVFSAHRRLKPVPFWNASGKQRGFPVHQEPSSCEESVRIPAGGRIFLVHRRKSRAARISGLPRHIFHYRIPSSMFNFPMSLIESHIDALDLFSDPYKCCVHPLHPPDIEPSACLYPAACCYLCGLFHLLKALLLTSPAV